MPRSAVESGTVSEPRIGRIVRALANSKYSIHDLTRCTGEGIENIARFNMPVELGMAPLPFAAQMTLNGNPSLVSLSQLRGAVQRTARSVPLFAVGLG